MVIFFCVYVSGIGAYACVRAEHACKVCVQGVRAGVGCAQGVGLERSGAGGAGRAGGQGVRRRGAALDVGVDKAAARAVELPEEAADRRDAAAGRREAAWGVASVWRRDRP